MRDVAGKTAFVTGGASGIGLAMARSFAAAGMNVAIADIEEGALQAATAGLAPTNAEIISLHVDVTDRAAMARAADATEAAFGKVHVVCNNAGVAVAGMLDTMSYADWDWVVNVNLHGVINGVQTFMERIKAHGEGGHFVNTASMAGHLGIGGLGVYNATKFAVVGISETMRVDLAPHRIGVSVLCPGVVNTNIFDSGRNRPAALQGETDTARLDGLAVAGDEVNLDALLQTALAPAHVGDMVLHGIIEDEAYIFTHPEFAEQVRERHQAMADAFGRWRAYRESAGI